MTGFWDSKSMKNRELDYDRWLEAPATDPEPDEDAEELAREAWEADQERRADEYMERQYERRHGVYD